MPSADLHALGRAARLAPNTHLLRAWRSLIELRVDDAFASVANFDEEITRSDAPIAPQLRVFAAVLTAVLLMLKSQDAAALRAGLAVLESRHRSDGGAPRSQRPCVLATGSCEILTDFTSCLD